MTGDAAELTRAAGGLVWRHGTAGVEVCLVHRPRYDDWSLPKGKLNPGEHPLMAAVREVREETGVQAVPRTSLPSVHYQVDGAAKTVDYWAMHARVVTPLRPNSEVDRVAWVPATTAMERVRYPHDAELVRHWVSLPAVTAVLLLVRHAHAGARSEWTGPDQSRPLSPAGAADAAALGKLLALFAPSRLVTASPDRCRQTLAPLADIERVPIEVDQRFDEGADPDATVAGARQLSGDGATTVICSQGAVIPPLLARLSGTGPQSRWTTAKGRGWLVPFAGEAALPPSPLP